MQNVMKKGKEFCQKQWNSYKKEICVLLFIFLTFVMIPAAVGGYENEAYGFLPMVLFLMIYMAADYLCYRCIRKEEAF